MSTSAPTSRAGGPCASLTHDRVADPGIIVNRGQDEPRSGAAQAARSRLAIRLERVGRFPEEESGRGAKRLKDDGQNVSSAEPIVKPAAALTDYAGWSSERLPKASADFGRRRGKNCAASWPETELGRSCPGENVSRSGLNKLKRSRHSFAPPQHIDPDKPVPSKFSGNPPRASDAGKSDSRVAKNSSQIRRFVPLNISSPFRRRSRAG